MMSYLAGYLRFDPLLAAAIILAVTLVLGRAVDMVRAMRDRKREKVQQGVVEFAQRFKETGASDTPEI